jgi:hypothetical protein
MPSTFTYPTGGDYREALFNTRRCFKDHALLGGEPTMDALGMPKPISGAFASVFTIRNADGRRWAVKCFTRFVNDQAIRYQRISQALQAVNKPWTVEFDYLPEGILCQGNWYPALKMEWIEATGLIPFIEAHLWEPQILADLAGKFAQMVGDLSALGIAHGDLQHGNLLVTLSGELKLIDYDGMFVPGLDKLGASERGHINYQSPARTMSAWGPYLDHFSAWIIYASLAALTIDPTLWSLLHDQGDEALIFHKDDFVDRRRSRALNAIVGSSDSSLQSLGTVIGALWTPDLHSVPPLDQAAVPLLNKRPLPSSASRPFTAVVGGTSTASSAIPDWVTQARAGAVGAATSVQSGSSWVAGHLPALQPAEFNPPRGFLRAIMVFWLAMSIVVGVSVGVGLIPVLTAVWAYPLLALLFIAVTGALFSHSHDWRAKRERKLVLRDRQADSSKTARTTAKLQKDKHDIDERERKAIEKIVKRGDSARTSEQKELAGVNTILAAQLSKVDRQKSALRSSETTEFGNVLRLLQEQHVLSYLRRATISSAKISGIGPGIVSALAACGIMTAADFTGVTYTAGARGGTQQVLIRLRNGTRVHPNGVGEKKANGLENWRRNVEMVARASQPPSLPQAQGDAIRIRYAQQRQSLDNEERAARAHAVGGQHQVAQKWISSHTVISAEMVAVRQEFAQERSQIDLRLADAQRQSGTAAWQRELAERELAAYRNVRYRSYIVGAIKS